MRVDVDSPGLPVPNSPYGLCGRKATLSQTVHRAQQLCERQDGRPWFPVPNNPYGLCGCKATLNAKRSEFRSCIKVEVDVLDSPSLIVRTVFVDIKQHLKKKKNGRRHPSY